jgi:L-amino acid N-acyltransferase YncA
MLIRRAAEADSAAMWPIFQAIVAEGSTWVFSAESSYADGLAIWFGPGVTAYVAEEDGRVVGMYKFSPNQPGRGSHVANAGFMVDPTFSGRGVGRAMGLHCLREAKRAGFLAMQFNIVVSTNESAIALWKKLGFSIAGTLPQVFRHKRLGLVDAFVMHRFLDDVED